MWDKTFRKLIPELSVTNYNRYKIHAIFVDVRFATGGSGYGKPWPAL
jgi:hypothetical protein